MTAAATGELPQAIERVEEMIGDMEQQLGVLKAMAAVGKSKNLPLPIGQMVMSLWLSYHNEGLGN